MFNRFSVWALFFLISPTCFADLPHLKGIFLCSTPQEMSSDFYLLSEKDSESHDSITYRLTKSFKPSFENSIVYGWVILSGQEQKVFNLELFASDSFAQISFLELRPQTTLQFSIIEQTQA